MNYLFHLNQYSPYAKSRGNTSMRTINRRAERNNDRLFYNSRHEWSDNANSDGKAMRKPYVNTAGNRADAKRAEREAKRIEKLQNLAA